MGGVKDYDPFAFVAFIVWGFFLYFMLSTNSPINPIGTNSTVTAQFGTTYTNIKWVLYLLAPMLPYIIMRFWHQADIEGDNPHTGGLGGLHYGGNIRGHFKSIQKQIAHGEKPKPQELPKLRPKTEIEE